MLVIVLHAAEIGQEHVLGRAIGSTARGECDCRGGIQGLYRAAGVPADRYEACLVKAVDIVGLPDQYIQVMVVMDRSIIGERILIDKGQPPVVAVSARGACGKIEI